MYRKQTLTVEEEDTTGGSYTVALSAQPTANVTVTVEGHSDTDVILTPDPPTLVFTMMNWETAQTVTVTAGNDADTADDTVTLTHSVASTDTGYHGITIDSVDVTVTDNDSPSMTVTPSPPSMLFVDEGGTATYTVKLDTAPTGDVTVAIASDDTGAATVSPASPDLHVPRTGTTPQTVTVTGVEDNDRDDENVTLSNNPSGAEYEQCKHSGRGSHRH